MRTTRLALIGLFCSTLSVALADPATTPSTLPAAATLPADSTVDRTLEQLFDVGTRMKSLRMSVVMAEADEETGKDEEYRGQFWILKVDEGDMQARVNFTQFRTGRKLIERRTEYLLAGDWLIERSYPRAGDDSSGRETWRQVRKPGDKTDLFNLGEGAFPLPLGQHPDAVRRQFAVTSIAATDDFPGLVGLHMVPGDMNRLRERMKWIRVWVDPADGLPRVIQSEDRGIPAVRTTRMSDVRFNADVVPADLTLEPIDEKQWQVVKEPMANP
jgi:hypothetical protein